MMVPTARNFGEVTVPRRELFWSKTYGPVPQAGTQLVKDIRLGNWGSGFGFFAGTIEFQGQLFFSARFEVAPATRYTS